MALYDTYIYDSNNQLIFKSNSPDDSSIYRLKLYPNGDLYFVLLNDTYSYTRTVTPYAIPR
jgi:hypothetical protein